MGWLDEWLSELGGANVTPLPVAKPAQSRQPAPEIKCVWVQSRRPANGDLGEIEPGFYTLVDGVVSMTDEAGKPLGKEHHLGPEEDARQIAYRLTWRAIQKARGEGDFNRAINYPRHSIA